MINAMGGRHLGGPGVLTTQAPTAAPSLGVIPPISDYRAWFAESWRPDELRANKRITPELMRRVARLVLEGSAWVDIRQATGILETTLRVAWLELPDRLRPEPPKIKFGPTTPTPTPNPLRARMIRRSLSARMTNKDNGRADSGLRHF